MKIFFINITKNLEINTDKKLFHPRHILPPIDVGYCASLLEKAGYETLFIDTAIERYNILGICEKIIGEHVDVVVLKPNIMTYRLTLELARELKPYCQHIICMGPVASMSVDFFIFDKSSIDFCIIGEPEYTLLEVINRIKNGQNVMHVAGAAYYNCKLIVETPRDLCENLDFLPYPKHELFIDKGYSFHYPINVNGKIKFGVILTSRGCPYSCIFCSPVKRVSFGKEHRIRSAQNVIAEMELLQSKGVNVIYFIDDIFTYNHNRVKLICNEIKAKKINVIWAAQIRADFSDFELLAKMKEAGCGCVNIGIESANDATLKMLQKKITLKDVKRTIKFCRELEINVVGDFIIGIPGQTKEDILESLKFAKRLRLDLVEALLFTPYPGSKAFEIYGKPEDIDIYSDYDFSIVPDCGLEHDELRRIQLQFYRAYYFNLRFIFNFLFKNRRRIIKNIFSEYAFLKKVFSFFIQ